VGARWQFVSFTSGEANGKAVRLGIDPSAVNPLTSPDGRLREITIQPDGTTASGDQVTAAMGTAGQTFFDALSCGTDPTLVPAGIGQPDPAAVKRYRDTTLKPAPTKPIPGKKHDYVGPDTEGSRCDPALGCLTGASCNGPE
jgi:hypothetical protein